jgi:hypothetical protein
MNRDIDMLVQGNVEKEEGLFKNIEIYFSFILNMKFVYKPQLGQVSFYKSIG